MYKVLLFKFRRHICKGSMVPPCLFYRESPRYRIVSTQGILNVVGKEEPWTLEIISYWCDKLASILDYFTLVDRQKLYFTNSAQKSGVICLSRPRIPTRLRVPTYSRPTSPSPRVPTSLSPRVPTSPRPHVPESPRPHVPASSSPRVLKADVSSVSPSSERI